MPVRVEVKEMENPHAGKCVWCSADHVLVSHVVLWGRFPVPACRVCGRVITRLVTWEKAARARYHENRAERRAEALSTTP